MCSLHMYITVLVRQVMVTSRHNIIVLYCTTTYTALLQYMYSLRYYMYISADAVRGVESSSFFIAF